MRITTWNVNGIRAIVNKDGFDWLKDIQPDILGLQEIKAKPEQVPDLIKDHPEYLTFWHSAERPGYSGTAVLYRPEPLSIQTGLGMEEFDTEGRTIRLEYPDFFLYNIYFPNGGQGNKRVPFKLDFYARLLEICDEHHAKGEKVIITGDFNTSHQEIDLANPKENEKNTGFLPEEREWITKYLEHNFVDAYRTLYPEKVEYTWWTYRTNARARGIGWRLDYFLVSSELMDKVEDVEVHGDIMGSDHCPVSLLLKE
ncbi:MAG TPA: exodeoxyribonuclease III [Chloroflexi bacterium]|nr:exodeoxyribonuclease III [Chloroflexota bacterium]